MGFTTSDNGLQTCGTCGNSGYSFMGTDNYHHFPTQHSCQVRWRFYSIDHGLLGQGRETTPQVFLAGDDAPYISGHWGPTWLYANVPVERVAFLTPEQAETVLDGGDRTPSISRSDVYDNVREVMGPERDRGNVHAEYRRAVVELAAELLGMSGLYADYPELVEQIILG